ncbi:MAG: hypothetical protein K2K14_02515 [Ruminococcus sp.]|nr:hypothetical protein [Ruminococcus sp.]
MPVKILHEIDVSENKWCNSAVMFKVWNGMGTITHRFGKEDEDYYRYEQLIINNKPILQEYCPTCPTCTGMLATGYGIENIDCPELKAVHECLNNNYTDIRTSAEMLKPLLALLDDGYYLLADVPHDPTDGNNHFFWSVPNNLTENPAFCDEYYHYGLFRCTDSFPKYLYPTQSADHCNQKRIDEYVEILRNNPSPPRALAYHEYGFISALLDGHHKATASALLGQKINCLTIIKASGCTFGKGVKYINNGIEINNVQFSNIKVPVPAGSLYGEYFPYPFKEPDEDLQITEYNLTGRKFPQAEQNAKNLYLDTESLMELYAFGLENTEFTDEIIDSWINTSNDEENYIKLKCAIKYLMLNNRDMAYRTAVKIIKKDYIDLPYKEAWIALLDFRDEQTEQLFIDHIVNYGKESHYYDIVTSYWN